jgi:hypothetical protein
LGRLGWRPATASMPNSDCMPVTLRPSRQPSAGMAASRSSVIRRRRGRLLVRGPCASQPQCFRLHVFRGMLRSLATSVRAQALAEGRLADEAEGTWVESAAALVASPPAKRALRGGNDLGASSGLTGDGDTVAGHVTSGPAAPGGWQGGLQPTVRLLEPPEGSKPLHPLLGGAAHDAARHRAMAGGTIAASASGSSGASFLGARVRGHLLEARAKDIADLSRSLERAQAQQLQVRAHRAGGGGGGSAA